MRPVKSYIAKRFQNSDAGLSLDTDALARYSDIIDLSIGDTDFITDDAIIDTAFREAKAGYMSKRSICRCSLRSRSTRR